MIYVSYVGTNDSYVGRVSRKDPFISNSRDVSERIVFLYTEGSVH